MAHTRFYDYHTLVVPGRVAAYRPGKGGAFLVDWSTNYENVGGGGLMSRSRWPPSAAVRQLLMAWSTPRCSHVGQDLSFSMKLLRVVGCYRPPRRVAGSRLLFPPREFHAVRTGKVERIQGFATAVRCFRETSRTAACSSFAWPSCTSMARRSAPASSQCEFLVHRRPASGPWHSHCWLAFDAPRDDNAQKS